MSASRPRAWTLGLAATLAAAVPVAPSAAGASRAAAARSGPRVQVMVVGQARTLAPARSLAASGATVSVSGRRCAVAAGTALAALAALRRTGGPRYALRDYGHCSRAPRDAASLFVTAIAGERNRGRDGWVYKVNERAGTAGAADPGGAFGDGRRLGSGQRVLWFWCTMGATGCQRTLAVIVPSAPVAPGAPVTATVTGYDDQGRGVAVAGARIALAGASAITDAGGHATLPAPAAPGAYALSAQASGLVPSFPATVRVT
jgi:hypothetical protein